VSSGKGGSTGCYAPRNSIAGVTGLLENVSPPLSI